MITPDFSQTRTAFALAMSFVFLAPATQAAPPLVVEIIVAKATEENQIISLTGEIVARDTLMAAFSTSGRIESVPVDQGDKVKKGDPLAKIESLQQEQALRSAAAGLATEQADQLQAIENLQRQEQLLERGATTRINRDNAEDIVRIAEGELAQAQATLDTATKALRDTVLIAPSDGTVTDRMVEPGQVVGAAQPVLMLALGDGIDAIFTAPEVLLTDTTTPSPVITLQPLDGPDIQFHGHIREVSPLVDPRRGTVEVTVEVDGIPDGIGYGDPVRGSATLAGVPRIVLPYTALTATQSGTAVWVVSPETMAVSLLPVTIDRYQSGRVIIRAGIDAGTWIVGKGSQLLYPGRIVNKMDLLQ